VHPFRAAVAEIIVVNNGSHLAAIEEIARRHDARVTTEPCRGNSRARNAGIRAARGNFIAFLDDDTEAGENWLARVVAPLADPTVDCVLGAIRAENPADPVHQAFEQFVCSPLPRAPTMFDAHATADRFPLRMAMNGFTMNVVFRRDVFERFGYFDQRFGRGTRVRSGEDTELLFNVLRRGGRILFEPRAVVVHSWPTDWKGLRRGIFQAGCGHTAILTKYFLEEPSLRGEILRYIASRFRNRLAHGSRASASVKLPRFPFLLGSLYGPFAFLLSGKK
jgi:cellulose synthase/poly-beta-1,6-N-acetylglucosamine synthase-like glycosyltransferase